jgi:hypothetical protein
MLGQPPGGVPILHADRQRLAGIRDQGGGFEPLVKTVTFDLGFDSSEHVIPDAGRHTAETRVT